METNNIKEQVLQLIKDAGNSKKHIIAEQKLIEICEPVIKKYYNIAKEYGNPINVGWDVGYNSLWGGICTFLSSLSDIENNKICFLYSDNYTEDDSMDVEAYIDMPLDWLDESYEKEYRNLCKEKNIEILEAEIKDLKKKIKSKELNLEFLKKYN